MNRVEHMKFLSDLGIEIKNKELLRVSLTHSSYTNEFGGENYERLEFLGDSVLQLIMSEYFFTNTEYSEGDMSKIRASYVCENALYEYSKKINLIGAIRVGNSLVGSVNETIVADIFEAVLAVIYLDKGYDVAKKYVLDIVLPYINTNHVFLSDYKSHLQEMVQTEKKSLEYVLIEETGPAHDKRFKVNVLVDDIVFGTGIGKSKKEAEQRAAKNAIEKVAR
ncbi:MAG: ribonuclease III [Bacilli bacterium]|nr:ribonuclease III [Bacilli bacterium]